ncbi:hypothetical protein CH063_07796 [Colletotrichum higginsianum]|uniref:Uncharacterized protein n=1 Tax=Colletotrichum higginsianum (strain IMI 349063) TaxID=759273 RepID=H1V7G8_COLHI|nr:hypothetical protein CH063_07796 [Colletotrichum higginsianum]
MARVRKWMTTGQPFPAESARRGPRLLLGCIITPTRPSPPPSPPPPPSNILSS